MEKTHSPRRAERRSAEPRLSVIVPTYGRPEHLERLLGRLDRQTLAPEDYEVVAVDDGSPEPLRADAQAYRFPLSLLRQENAGPGAARNLALQHVRAPLTLILNDDAVPAEDLLERHLEAHARGRGKVAVLGTFEFSADALRHPFVQALAGSDLLFDFPGLRHDALHPWQFFWTCNLSIQTGALREIGGFDAEGFREAVCEDVELGWRLAQQGWSVLHRADARCDHEHRLSAEAYFRRMLRLGFHAARMWQKHGDPAMLWQPAGSRIGDLFLRNLQSSVEGLHDTRVRVIEKLRSFEAEHMDRPVPAPVLEQVRKLARTAGLVQARRGMLLALAGTDPVAVIESGPPRGRLTSIIAVSHRSLAHTRRCVDSLRAAREDGHPQEILFVDNGSTDGSAEWLARQPDVRLIRNAGNRGAPCARNQALPLARGEWVVFLDNDAFVPPGWLARLLWHAEVDPKVGCVGPLSDRAAHGQQVELPGGTAEDALRHDARLAAGSRRQARYATLLSSFCLLVKRSLIERIGGFDERFSPWGFEDDDLTLRSVLAGFRNRLALDVFVRHEAYGGPKQAQHHDLLLRNWERFAEKWGLEPGSRHGDYEAVLRAITRTGVRKDAIVEPLAAPDASCVLGAAESAA